MSKPSRIVLASDHAGFELKERIKAYLELEGIPCIDVGTDSKDPVDYPPIIRKGCEEALKLGVPAIIFGGSGQGEAMAANKMKGIRAALCWNEESVKLARAHNDANVLSLGARLIPAESALDLVDLFLETPFEGGRHLKRVQDLDTPLS